MIGVVYWGSDLQSTAKGEIIKMSTGEKEKWQKYTIRAEQFKDKFYQFLNFDDNGKMH